MGPVFNHHPLIDGWSVDTADIDNVLRIETNGELKETDIINLIKKYGYYIEALPD
ncbi:hypothetical protein C900_02017 [Fulvivirga imtechensis AK7]|uniref:HMA domain-containing protein n=1 Tax=Fulvivirga imtechensis AK7 TaxID=1237149 RepID=L8JXR7_9BACT|nr:hypothetical protein [Fulvivirga imtechensis]ELR72022.1 hypothetical protein C900_02017 [Fulvivirga imtechensis AK7]